MQDGKTGRGPAQSSFQDREEASSPTRLPLSRRAGFQRGGGRARRGSCRARCGCDWARRVGNRYNPPMNMQSAVLAIARVFGAEALEIGPLFLLALFLGAVLEEFISSRTIERFLTGRRPATTFIASTTGALIPPCTCRLVPQAVSLP